jgi:hypothetical protein
MVKGFREMTGKWEIDLEVPFGVKELHSIAQAVGF